MGIFGIKKKEAAPQAPPFPEIKAIKDTVNPEFPVFPDLPKTEAMVPPFTFEPIKIYPPPFPSTALPVFKPVTEEMSREETAVTKLREPIFVKIDKFKDALTHFEIVKKKLRDTTEMLDKIKEMRAKEDEELELWAKEVEAVKERLETIDRKLFSKIEQ
jgi:hypothetical protein